MIARDGIGAVTARAVAREAGVSLGTVSHHFSSLELLLVAALEHGAGRVIGELERLALDLQAADWDTEQWANAVGASDPGERAIRLVAMVTGLVLAELGLPAQGRLQRLRRALGAEVATLAV